VGIDASPRAIAKATTKARYRALDVGFMIVDAFALETLGRRFGSILDCGLFHVFDDNERPVYAASLAEALEPGGILYLLCFSDRQPGIVGPRRVSPEEIRATFVEGWSVREIVPTVFETNVPDRTAQAWRATIARV
jgi:SAM-dependent methyltransferase